MLKRVYCILHLITFFSIFLLSACAKKGNVTLKPYDPKLESYSAEQLLSEGEKALARNKMKKGIEYLHALEVKYPFSTYARQAQLDIIYANYKMEENIAALAAADRYIRTYPAGPNTDYAYYIKGLINTGRGRDIISRKVGVDPAERDLKHIKQAFYDFSIVVRDFPQSPYAKDSYARLIYLRNLIARHELILAEFYYHKKAYIAAANRASGIVKHYQGTPQVEDALVLMVKAYRALGEKELETNALEVLRLNYPNKKAL
jgi:outer membrane protein assembly factor BamD